MRGRILLTLMTMGAVALAGCSKRDSLYIDPGKDEHSAKRRPEAAKSAPAAPASTRPEPQKP